MKNRSRFCLLVTLTLGVCLVSAQAFAYEFQLTNGSTDHIYGRCGTNTAFGLPTGQSRDFSCNGPLSVLVWNDDGTDLDAVGSHTFACASGQVEQVTVSSVSPYSAASECLAS